MSWHSTQVVAQRRTFSGAAISVRSMVPPYLIPGGSLREGANCNAAVAADRSGLRDNVEV